MQKLNKVTLRDGTISWEVRVRQGGRGSRQLRRRFDSAKEARAFLDSFGEDRKRLEGSVVELGSFHGTTFERESENWLADLKLRSSAGHYRRCEEMIKDFNQSFGRLEPNKITVEFLSVLQKKLKDREGYRRKKVWSNGTVNLYIGCIVAVLNFSVRQRRIPFNPASGYRKLPKNSPEMLFWSEKEARSFLRWASAKYDQPDIEGRKSRKNYIVYLLALNTGLRAGEIWGLKIGDLCFDKNGAGDTIFVRRQLSVLTREFAPLKGELKANRDKSRHVPCPPDLRREIELYVGHNKLDSNNLLISMYGRPVHHDSFNDKFLRDLALWKGRKIRFHDLRHTAATLMLSKGVDVKTVKEILGHEDISTTMKYVHMVGDRIKEVSRLFAICPA